MLTHVPAFLIRRRMKFLAAGFASLFLFVAACGGSDDPTPDTSPTSTDSCTGTQLTDDQLCQLTCNQTTTAQAEQILGKPDVSSGDLIQYTYECVVGSSANLIEWDLFFNPTTGLGNVMVSAEGTYAGATVPSCLSACGQ
jgi:hypothetical protein